jgi:hypothetical protein
MKNLKWPFIFIQFLVLVTFCSIQKGYSQNTQVWIDGFVYKEFGKSWEYEANPGYNKLLAPQGWTDVYFCNTASWQVNKWYMAEGSLELHYTFDQVNENSIEVRPWVGQKFSYPKFINAIHLDKPFFYVRLDQRFLWYPESDVSETKTRFRPRIGGKFILNNTTLKSKTYYIPWFVESFINLNGEASERYASRNRIFLGLGYVFNPKWRLELDYISQRARNTFKDQFVKSDNIIWLQLKYYWINGKKE